MPTTSSGGYEVKSSATLSVAAAQTDSSLVAAVAGKRIRIINFILAAGGTATTFVFNSKPGGAGTAISPVFSQAIGAVAAPGLDESGYFTTNVGEGLTVTTGAGATTGVWIKYVEIS